MASRKEACVTIARSVEARVAQIARAPIVMGELLLGERALQSECPGAISFAKAQLVTAIGGESTMELCGSPPGLATVRGGVGPLLGSW